MEDFVQKFDLVVQNLSDNDLLVVFESLKLIKQSLSKPVYKGLICECKLRSEALFSALNLIFQTFSLKVGPFAGAVVSEDFVRVIRIAIEVYSEVLHSVHAPIQARTSILSEEVVILLTRYHKMLINIIVTACVRGHSNNT